MPPTDSVFARLARGAKAITRPPHPAYRDTGGLAGLGFGTTDLFNQRLPDDYWANRDRVGDGSFTGIVENTLAVKSRAFTEIAPQVGIVSDDDPSAAPEPDPDHPLNELLAEPNEAMGWRDIGEYIVASADTAGTAYIAKVGTADVITSLWPLYPEGVEPISRGRDFLTEWRYTISGITSTIRPEDMIVYRNRLNRTDHRVGASSLEPILREVATDEEAARFASTILHNLGVPGVVLTARDQYNPPGPDEAKSTLSTWRDRFGGSRRGDPWIQSDYDISVVSFSPQQLDLRTLRQIPEERVTGALGVPAILAGFGAGLDRATYSNAGELRAFFTEQTLIPLWANIAETLTRTLLPIEDRLAGRVIYFDVGRVRALQEDRNAEAERIVRLVTGKVLTVDEGRELLGYGPLPDNIVDVDEGVGTAFVEGEPDDVELTNDETVDPVAQATGSDTDNEQTRAALGPMFKADGFPDAAWEDEYADTIGGIFAGWASRFADEIALDDQPDSVIAAADRAIDEDELRQALNDLGVRLVESSARGADAIPTKAATLNPDDVATGMTRFLDQHATRRARSMSDWTATRVRNIVTKGLEAGDTPTDIAGGVGRWLKDPARARTVAVTEVTAARNAAANYAAQVDPRPLWKTWVTNTDGHQRESHGTANGQRVLDFEAFNVGGYAMSHPGDPSAPAAEVVNCRCRLQFNLATNIVGGTPRSGF